VTTSRHTAARCLAVLAASAVIAGCGGGTKTVTRQGSSSAPAAPTPAPTSAPAPAVVAGPATVCTKRSSVGSTWDTAVAFTLTNRSASAVVDVPYRVTVTGAGKTLAVTKGDDTINPYETLAGHESRIVVVEPGNRHPLHSKPTAATVQTYAGSPAGGVPVPEPAQWRVTNQHILASAHEVSANLTNTGQPAVIKTMDAVVRRGYPGPIVAAGVLNLTTGGQAVVSGQTVPVGGEVTGNLPSDTSGLVVEFSVQPSAPRGD
jgi:hypothetical protein